MFDFPKDAIKFKDFQKNFSLKEYSKGYRGIIYTLNFNNKRFAVKVPAKEELIPSFKKEALILKFLNEKGIFFVPKLIYIGEDFFVYEFIEGITFKQFLKTSNNKDSKIILRKLLIYSYCLDKLGVFKDEFQRPFTNVLVNNRKVFLLDFERGALNKFWKNVPQFLQFLLALKILSKDEIILFGRKYKKNPWEVIKAVLKKI